MNPLFIPLKTEYYEKFAGGDKPYEIRKHGPRWNARTCKVGRPVVISKGYGKANRISGVITDFRVTQAWNLGPADREAVKACMGSMEIEVALIFIEVRRA